MKHPSEEGPDLTPSLVLRLRAGDDEAGRLLDGLFRPVIHRLCVGYLHSPQAADDDPLAVDIATSGAGIVLTRTHYGRLGGIPDANLAPGSGDPGFVADGDPRPGPSSPLIDGGVGDPPGGSGAFDCDGHARVVGLAVDIGAFEWAPPADPVFEDGFDPPG